MIGSKVDLVQSLVDRSNLPSKGLTSHKGHHIALLSNNTLASETVLLGRVPFLTDKLNLSDPLFVLDLIESTSEIAGESTETIEGTERFEDCCEVGEDEGGGEDSCAGVGAFLSVGGVGCRVCSEEESWVCCFFVVIGFVGWLFGCVVVWWDSEVERWNIQLKQ